MCWSSWEEMKRYPRFQLPFVYRFLPIRIGESRNFQKIHSIINPKDQRQRHQRNFTHNLLKKLIYSFICAEQKRRFEYLWYKMINSCVCVFFSVHSSYNFNTPKIMSSRRKKINKVLEQSVSASLDEKCNFIILWVYHVSSTSARIQL